MYIKFNRFIYLCNYDLLIYINSLAAINRTYYEADECVFNVLKRFNICIKKIPI